MRGAEPSCMRRASKPSCPAGCEARGNLTPAWGLLSSCPSATSCRTASASCILPDAVVCRYFCSMALAGGCPELPPAPPSSSQLQLHVSAVTSWRCTARTHPSAGALSTKHCSLVCLFHCKAAYWLHPITLAATRPVKRNNLFQPHLKRWSLRRQRRPARRDRRDCRPRHRRYNSAWLYFVSLAYVRGRGTHKANSQGQCPQLTAVAVGVHRVRDGVLILSAHSSKRGLPENIDGAL
jgi:hypothetical protein